MRTLPFKTKNKEEIEISFVDSGQDVTALIIIKSAPSPADCECKTLVLWEGEDYEKIGQYTDADIDSRIKQLLI